MICERSHVRVKVGRSFLFMLYFSYISSSFFVHQMPVLKRLATLHANLQEPSSVISTGHEWWLIKSLCYVEAHPQCLSRFPAIHAICISTSLIQRSGVFHVSCWAMEFVTRSFLEALDKYGWWYSGYLGRTFCVFSGISYDFIIPFIRGRLEERRFP